MRFAMPHHNGGRRNPRTLNAYGRTSRQRSSFGQYLGMTDTVNRDATTTLDAVE